MEVHQLRYFLEVARRNNFSRAAEACFVSQPSLSQQIKKLEEELGEPLFKRTRTGARLTEFGQSMLGRANRIVSEISLIEEDAQARRGEVQGRIRLGAIPTIAPYLLPQLIKKCLQRLPKVEFLVTEETTEILLQKLVEGTVDMAILSPPFEGQSEMTVEPLITDELHITLPASHPLTTKPTIALTDIADFPLVLMKEAHCLRRQSISLCEASGVRPTVTIESSQMDTVLSMIEIGLGFSFTPEIARPALRHRKVVYRSVSPQPVNREIVLVWPKRQSLTRAQAAFREMAMEPNAQSNGNPTDSKESSTQG